MHPLKKVPIKGKIVQIEKQNPTQDFIHVYLGNNAFVLAALKLWSNRIDEPSN